MKLFNDKYTASSLKIARESRGLTITEAAAITKDKVKDIMLWESGKILIPETFIERCSHAYGYPISFFEQHFKQDKALRKQLLKKLGKKVPEKGDVFTAEDMFLFFEFLNEIGVEYRIRGGIKYYTKGRESVQKQSLINHFLRWKSKDLTRGVNG